MDNLEDPSKLNPIGKPDVSFLGRLGDFYDKHEEGFYITIGGLAGAIAGGVGSWLGSAPGDITAVLVSGGTVFGGVMGKLVQERVEDWREEGPYRGDY